MSEQEKVTNTTDVQTSENNKNVFKDVFYVPKYTLNIEQIQSMPLDEKTKRYNNDVKKNINDYSKRKYFSITIKTLWIWIIIIIALVILISLGTYFIYKII